MYERYHRGSGGHELETSFSVAKSFVSTLAGIAIDEGRIGGVDEPLTDYLPELAARDPRFERITLEDLLGGPSLPGGPPRKLSRAVAGLVLS